MWQQRQAGPNTAGGPGPGPGPEWGAPRGGPGVGPSQGPPGQHGQAGGWAQQQGQRLPTDQHRGGVGGAAIPAAGGSQNAPSNWDPNPQTPSMWVPPGPAGW